MRRRSLFIFLFTMVLSLLLLGEVFAEQKSITLPKGTTVEKLGPRHFKFKLPDGKSVEVRNFNPKTGTIGYVGIINPDPPTKPVTSGKSVGIINPDPPTKPVTSGKQGQLLGQAKPKPVRLPAGTEYVIVDDEPTYIVKIRDGTKLPKSDYVMIDDEPTYLPATIQFQSETKGLDKLSPQPDPRGRLKR